MARVDSLRWPQKFLSRVAGCRGSHSLRFIVSRCHDFGDFGCKKPIKKVHQELSEILDRRGYSQALTFRAIVARDDDSRRRSV